MIRLHGLWIGVLLLMAGGLPILAQPTPMGSTYGLSIDTLNATVPIPETHTTDRNFYTPRFSPALKMAGAVWGGAALWTATYAWLDEPLQKYTQVHRNKPADKFFHLVEPMGRHRLMVPATGAVALAGFAFRSPNLRKVGTVSLGSLIISGGLTGLIKNQAHRYRPSETDENHYYDWGAEVSGNTSFPSSHTTVAFAVATSIASVYGKDHKLVPPLAYGIATAVGLSRINDNAHWATDVMAGAAVGYFSAKGASFLYSVAEKHLYRWKGRLVVVPQFGAGPSSLYVALSF